MHRPNWVKIGYSNWKNATTNIVLHEISKTHIEASLKIEIKRTSLPIIPSLKYNVITNRLVVKQLLDITLYLGRHCLPFSGHREAWTEILHSNFKDLIFYYQSNHLNLRLYIKTANGQ